MKNKKPKFIYKITIPEKVEKELRALKLLTVVKRALISGSWVKSGLQNEKMLKDIMSKANKTETVYAFIGIAFSWNKTDVAMDFWEDVFKRSYNSNNSEANA